MNDAPDNNERGKMVREIRNARCNGRLLAAQRLCEEYRPHFDGNDDLAKAFLGELEDTKRLLTNYGIRKHAEEKEKPAAERILDEAYESANTLLREGEPDKAHAAFKHILEKTLHEPTLAKLKIMAEHDLYTQEYEQLIKALCIVHPEQAETLEAQYALDPSQCGKIAADLYDLRNQKVGYIPEERTPDSMLRDNMHVGRVPANGSTAVVTKSDEGPHR